MSIEDGETAGQPPKLLTKHADHLALSGILRPEAEQARIHSHPDGGYVIPWCNGKTTVEQIRWDEPYVNDDGDTIKYYWPAGIPTILHIHRKASEPGSTVVLAEGFKQSLMAALNLPESYGVAAFTGCWSKANEPLLDVVRGHHVVYAFDADLTTNPAVWKAAERHMNNARANGAASVRFIILPGTGSEGLDDYLAKFGREDRAFILGNLLDQAVAKLPKEPKRTAKVDPDDLAKIDAKGRPIVLTSGDADDVIKQTTAAMVERHSGARLFNFGGAISTVEDGTVSALDVDTFFGVANETIAYRSEGPGGDMVRLKNAEPSPRAFRAAWRDVGAYARLERVTRCPFFDESGRLVTTPGYDQAARTLLLPSDDLDALAVPDKPSKREVSEAAALLRDWLGDFPFKDETDAARAIGSALTLILRALFPLAPMNVITATLAGSGKGLLLDVLTIATVGQAVGKMPYAESDEEIRKAVTSLFLEGREVVGWDEAHTINSKQLARALTATTYEDRKLGGNDMVRSPNRLTMFAMGNAVQIRGDMTRRVVPIRLHPMTSTPHLRNDFKRSNLPRWTTDNRPVLLSALLTLIRAWFAAGCPEEPKTTRMGSFEAWDRTIGGILALAGMPGFLDGATEWSTSGDYAEAEWIAHTEGLWKVFGEQEFTSAQVVGFLDVIGSGRILPPPFIKLKSVSYLPDSARREIVADVAKSLGMAYSRRVDRPVKTEAGELVLTKAGASHGHVSKWLLRPVKNADDLDSDETPGGGGTGGTGGTLFQHVKESAFSDDEGGEKNFSISRGAAVPPVPPVPPEAITGIVGTPKPLKHPAAHAARALDRYDWTPSPGRACPMELAGHRCERSKHCLCSQARYGVLDHVRRWRTPSGAELVTSEPYGVDPGELAAFTGACRVLDLAVTVHDPAESIWLPGVTELISIKKAS